MLTERAQASLENVMDTLAQRFTPQVLWAQEPPEGTTLAQHMMVKLFELTGDYLGLVYVQVWAAGGWDIAPLCPYASTVESMYWLARALEPVPAKSRGAEEPPNKLASGIIPRRAAELMRAALLLCRPFISGPVTLGPEDDRRRRMEAEAGLETALDAAEKCPTLFM